MCFCVIQHIYLYLAKPLLWLSNKMFTFEFEFEFVFEATNVTHQNGPLARYVILRVAHAPGMPGKFSPPPRFSDPDMHHGTCVTHVPWCMSGTLTSSFLWSRPRGKTFPAFPAHAQPAILRIWQEAHGRHFKDDIVRWFKWWVGAE